LESAKKTALPIKAVTALLEQIDEIYAAKGKNIVHLNLRRDKLNETTLAELLIGRTGNLRAPALRKGRTLIVGFDEAMYKQVFR